MSPLVFGTADIAMVFVNCGEVRSTAFGASEEGLRSLAVGNGVTQAETAATLDKGGTVFEGADGGLAAKEVGG
jgi:hypothetical protein